MTPIILIGWDIRDAQGLAMRRRQIDRGRRVTLVSASARHAERLLRGHRLTESQWEATDRARQHERWHDIEQVLATCQVWNGADPQ